MPIPDYQTIMLPLLNLVSDGKEHRIRDCYDRIADEYNLSSQEREQLLPSGKGPTINNRVQWAKVYLVKAALLEAPKRGVICISQRGKDLLSKNPSKIDYNVLKQYPEFVEFRRSRHDEGETTSEEQEPEHDKTPDEMLEYAYQALRETLASELIEHVTTVSPEFFERLVVDLLVGMGYGGSREDAGSVVGRSGDGGIDGIIKEDRLGLDAIYIQAKRWDGVVGRPEIQKFVGALQGQRSRKGVFITTSSFSREARDYADSIESKIILIDGDRLCQLMIDSDIGVSMVNTYATKRVDSDYFAEE